MILDYLSIYPDGVIWYQSINMFLISDTNSAYLILPKYCIRAATWFMFGININKTRKQKTNAPVQIICNNINNSMASAAECKIGGIYMVGQRSWPICISAIELGHLKPQIRTPMYTHNSAARGILTAAMRKKLSNHSICASIGFVPTSIKDNSTSYVTKENSMWWTTSQNTTHHGTTRKYGTNVLFASKTL